MRPGEFERKVGCNLDQALWDRLSVQVERFGETRGCLLRIALEEYLSRLESDQRIEALGER
jgi:metal-responsive CopG/Arc/MetJ family transcriptional regulator